MEEEFQESEVIFQENSENEENEEEYYNFPKEIRKISKAKRKMLKAKKNINNNSTSSAPVNIPEKFSGNNSLFKTTRSDLFDDDDDDDDGEMEPPHVIIGRRIAAKVMAFSVCTGKGRTLKGRDLSEVRNSILRMTGFLET